ncbi:MAG: tetratricopeptide repeat protein [Cyanobacteria bacterium P01_A01_bin.135]
MRILSTWVGDAAMRAIALAGANVLVLGMGAGGVLAQEVEPILQVEGALEEGDGSLPVFDYRAVLDDSKTLHEKNRGRHRLAVQQVAQSPKGSEAAAVEGDRKVEADWLLQKGIEQFNVSRFREALQSWEQALEIYQEIGDRQGEGDALGNLGLAYDSLGQYQQAITCYQQVLEIFREIGDRQGEGIVVGNLGITYNILGQYQQAIAFYEQHLEIAREVGDRQGEGNALGNLGIAHNNLGQYQQAIAFSEQHLEIAREISDRQGEGIALGNLGNAYDSLGQYQQAIAFHEQHLEIDREAGDRQGEGIALGNLGNAYNNLGQYQQAIASYRQALEIFREISDRRGESFILANLGVAYSNLGQHEQTIASYQQALAIHQDIGDRAAEGTVLSNIGELLTNQNLPQLAILFLKQSVNIREAIRDDIRELPTDQQQSFADTVADTYRNLADLLLQENRILEAQRVLDLLKVQELDDYLDTVRSPDTDGIDLLDPEAEISNKAIAIGRDLAQLRAIPPAELTDDQKQQIANLDDAQRAIIADFRGFIESPEIQTLVAQLQQREISEQEVLAELDEFINLQNNLRDLEQNAVLIYPLILPDRLELVLVTPFSEPTRYPVNVEQDELNETIVAFRQSLRDPRSHPEAIAQQLYDWLIAPMASDLDAIGAETLLYAPDSVLRYIPLAALHDGEQWLAGRFRINHITATSLLDFDLQPDRGQPIVLAAAFSEGAYEVKAGDRTFPFAGLPYAGLEVETLVDAFPGSTQLMNRDFSRAATEPMMDSHTIVHLATHAAFVQGTPSESFILFGNGEHLTLEELKTWEGRFNQVDLFVLSACETGLGGSELGNGEEILGFGYLMQEAGAEAAIASLWQVSDGGTQALMNAFYTALSNGYSKAEALQRAQQALIAGDLSLVGETRGTTLRPISPATGEPITTDSLSHPYYWAPFILIGNGL